MGDERDVVLFGDLLVNIDNHIFDLHTCHQRSVVTDFHLVVDSQGVLLLALVADT